MLIAVIGLTIVLGLCGQINLAQAGFFGIGAYAVGLGTDRRSGMRTSGSALAARPRGGARFSAPSSVARRSGSAVTTLAMVTISFQQIVTLVLINWIPVTRGPDGVPNIGRPAAVHRRTDLPRRSASSILAAVAYRGLAHARDTKLGRAMRAVRDNELAAGVVGIDVYRTKVLAFAIGALLAEPRRRPVRRRFCLCQPRPVHLRRLDRAC